MSTSQASTAPAAGPIVGACPRCGASLTNGIGTCLNCRLDLSDPHAEELSDLNRRHEALRHRRDEVTRAIADDLAVNARRRAEVLAALAALGPPDGAPQYREEGAQPLAGGGDGFGTQALLLALGVLCLAIAAAVFAAVGWGRLDEIGQATVLIAATVAAGAGGLLLHRRGLRATGEAVLLLAATMVLVDTAVFGEALGAGAGDLRFWSGGLAVLAGLGAATRRSATTDAGPPLSGAIVGVIAAQLTLPLAVAAALGDGSAPGFAPSLWDPRLTQVGIAAVAAVGIVQAVGVTLAARRHRWAPSAPTAATALLTAAAVWFVAVCMSLALTEPPAQAAILAAAAIAAGLAATLPQLDAASTNLAAAGTTATALGAWATLAPSGPSLTVWLGAGAGLAVLAAAGGPRRVASGAVVVSAAVLAATSWVLFAAAGDALANLLALLGDTSAGAEALTDSAWAEVLAVALIVTAAGLGAQFLARSASTRRTAIVGLVAGATVLAGYLAFTLPPMIGVSRLVWAIALSVAAAAGAAVAVADITLDVAADARVVTDTDTEVAVAIAAPTGFARVRALGWAVAAATACPALALAHVGADLGLWWVFTGGAAALVVLTGRAGRTGESRSLATVGVALAVATAASTAALFDAGPMWVTLTATIGAGALAIAAAGLIWLGRSTSSSPASWVATTTAVAVTRSVIGTALAAQAVAILAATSHSVATETAATGTVGLLVGAFAWFAVALLIRSTPAAAVGAVFAQCAAWLSLGIAGVDLIEAYTIPGALVLLVLGVIALRRSPQQSSWAALSPALAFALVPSSLVALGEGGARPLVLIGVGAVFLLAGAALRLGAPTVAGAWCVAMFSVIEVAPLVGSLPRYVTFGTAGAVLLVAGATFERRRAELNALQRRVRALR